MLTSATVPSLATAVSTGHSPGSGIVQAGLLRYGGAKTSTFSSIVFETYRFPALSVVSSCDSLKPVNVREPPLRSNMVTRLKTASERKTCRDTPGAKAKGATSARRAVEIGIEGATPESLHPQAQTSKKIAPNRRPKRNGRNVPSRTSKLKGRPTQSALRCRVEGGRALEALLEGQETPSSS